MDKKIGVRDARSDHSSHMVHMYSVLAARSRLPSLGYSHEGSIADLLARRWQSFLPSHEDIHHVKQNLVIIVARMLTEYIKALSPLSKSVPKHIQHKYTQQMSQKSEVRVLDVLIKNEVRHSDMVDIMNTMQGYPELSTLKVIVSHPVVTN